MAQAASGEIYAWGLNNYHQLGITKEDDGVEDLNGEMGVGFLVVIAPDSDTNGTNGQADDAEINQVRRPFPSKAFQPTKKWHNIAGVQHVVCRDEAGELFSMVYALLIIVTLTNSRSRLRNG